MEIRGPFKKENQKYFHSSWIFFSSGTFEDKEITHVEGEVDPIRDLEIINEELRLKDEEAFMKYFDDLEKKYQRGEKKLKQEYVSQNLLLRYFLLLFNHSISVF